VLPCISHVKHPDRTHEVELWSTDINVGAVLDEAEGEVIGQLSELGLDWTKYGWQGSGAALRADKG